MADLKVTDTTIEGLIESLQNHEWQIPQFQREFVWSTGDVIELLHSIINARPIGMVTIWEQGDDSTLELDALSLPDKDPISREEIKKRITEHVTKPNNVFAVLDGLQRCTSIALAFGGFHTNHGDYRTSGRFYLHVASVDPIDQIVFFKEKDVLRKQFDKDAICFSQGYFPLSSNTPSERFLNQWIRYTQSIKESKYYANGKLPPDDELNRRDNILKKAFEGIVRTKLAVYIVPDNYSLSDICDIFQTLNTTGTKVSTVDLIHSWLYADTSFNNAGPIRLREWIEDFGQKDGAIGWSDLENRPELPVQMVTACHVALELKAEPRKVGKGSVSQIQSIKSSDLLATPTAHWKLIMQNDDKLASYLKDFQTSVSGGLFPWNWCPYPVTSTIYVAIRFHYNSDNPGSHPWSIDDLNALFRAYFWRNSLTNRYDQGFLTQLGTDIVKLKELLNKRRDYPTGNTWAASIEMELSKLIDKPLPSQEDLYQLVTDGRHSGAMQKALILPMLARADKDLLDDSIKLGYSGSEVKMQLHHIFPRDWCRNNVVGDLANLLDKKKADRDWVNSLSNLMPLSSQSNNAWKAQNPGQILKDKHIKFAHCAKILEASFIDEECFDLLLLGAEGMESFLKKRAALLKNDFLQKMKIQI